MGASSPRLGSKLPDSVCTLPRSPLDRGCPTDYPDPCSGPGALRDSQMRWQTHHLVHARLISPPCTAVSLRFFCTGPWSLTLNIAALPSPHVDRWLPRWLSGKIPACPCRRRGFHPWVGKIPWRRKWQDTHSSVLAWKIPWTEEPESLQGCKKESDVTELLNSNMLAELRCRRWPELLTNAGLYITIWSDTGSSSLGREPLWI